MIQEIPIKCRKSAVFPNICANGTLSWGYVQIIVFLLIHGLVNHLLKGFWNWKEKTVGAMGRQGKKWVQCRVRGTSAQGWPNTKHCRLPIRKPLKPLTVNRKKMAST